VTTHLISAETQQRLLPEDFRTVSFRGYVASIQVENIAGRRLEVVGLTVAAKNWPIMAEKIGPPVWLRYELLRVIF
jgi:hypothetical protein